MGFTQNRRRRCGGASAAEAFGPAKRMDANFHTLKAGMRSRKPTGSSASMPGAARPWIRAVCSRARTAVHSLPFTSRKCASPFRPVERRLYGRGMDREKVGLPPQAKPTTQPLRLPRPTPPSGDRSDLSSIARIKMLPWRACPHLGLLR